MDAETWAQIVKAAGELTLSGLLFALWWLERSERIASQKEHKEHLAEDIEHLLDQTEQIRRNGGTGI